MRWSRVALIFRRELRDQLRDRRTVFMVFVLPLLLYPILGFVVSQLSAAFEKKPSLVVLIGSEHLPKRPPLLVEDDTGRLRFHPALLESPAEADRFIIRRLDARDRAADPERQLRDLRAGVVDAFVIIPPDVGEQIASLRRPTIRIAYDRADEKSQFAYLRVDSIIRRWQEAIVAGRLARDDKPAEYVEPVRVQPVDVARQVLGTSAASGSIWVKVFPFLLVMMSLTGAFYPAVDLCAGEKERGTMETLLISPAYRSEIVVGKFMTVMAASVATALLNLAIMGLTMAWVATQVTGGLGADINPESGLAELNPPSMTALFWIVLLLIPLSGFFSAVSLSLAILARSMKEGQYYMTPLYLFTMPLIFLTLMPGIEMNEFYSLVPVTGVSLLLKDLMLEQYVEARRFFLPVLISTIVYGAVALRWAVGQFRTEQVLFREAERFDLVGWLRHLLRDKEAVPNGGAAITCFALMLALAWYLQMFMAGRMSPIMIIAAGLIVAVAGPPVLLALVFTSRPRTTLRLRWPGFGHLAFGVGLALAVNPLVNELRPLVEGFFPVSSTVKQALETLEGQIPNLATALLVFAVLPAVCEELAFRGYILSGLQSAHRVWTAILLSALLFGLLHVLQSLYQQLFNATLLGILLGLMAIRSRSLIPCLAFHFTNNALVVLSGTISAAGPRWLYRDPSALLYHWPWVVLSLFLTGGAVWSLVRAIRSNRIVPTTHRSGPSDPLTAAEEGIAFQAPTPEVR